MKDELKIFTGKHREQFELYTLDLDDAWQGIEEKLDAINKRSIHVSWWGMAKVAAVVLCTLTIGFGFYLNNQRMSRNENGISLHNISSELADTEAYYSSQIREKMELIELQSGEVDPEVLGALEILDDDYKSLKKDLNDYADSEEVINAMIEHYRLKLSMLEKILEEIQKNKDNEEVLAI
ncbi:MAG: hypothetical protein MI975_05060 [Cytophagales bacterium]|nr:hypothetical protein [Cytophagales bacterium]